MSQSLGNAVVQTAWTVESLLKVSYIQNEFMRSSFLPKCQPKILRISALPQSYIYQVLQTIQMNLIPICVWAEPAVLGSAKTALKFIYKI